MLSIYFYLRTGQIRAVESVRVSIRLSFQATAQTCRVATPAPPAPLHRSTPAMAGESCPDGANRDLVGYKVMNRDAVLLARRRVLCVLVLLARRLVLRILVLRPSCPSCPSCPSRSCPPCPSSFVAFAFSLSDGPHLQSLLQLRGDICPPAHALVQHISNSIVMSSPALLPAAAKTATSARRSLLPATRTPAAPTSPAGTPAPATPAAAGPGRASSARRRGTQSTLAASAAAAWSTRAASTRRRSAVCGPGLQFGTPAAIATR